ncbi:ABC1 family-domain-containing protein [Chytridium lagenaria]|nr:ABC1 family-domain-containing protein [Chytridium lagenaria]
MHTPMRQTCFLASSLRRMLSATGITPARMHIHLPQRSPMLRFTSTADGSHDGPKAEPKTKRSTRLYAAGFLVVAGVSYYLYDPQSFRWHYVAISRSARTTLVCAVMALDYKLTLSRNYPSQQAYQDAKSACHERCAKWMLWVCNLNGGIYIKLYTETMKVLQDRCPPSTLAALEALFLQDTNSTLSDHFSDLDPTPLGVASLAQVHKATLKSTGEVVAVKIQHPHLDEHAPIDIKICGWFASRVRKVFPEFEFDWLADELREKAENAREGSSEFAGDTVVKIPEVLWAKRRILVMEYINGGKVDNLEYMRITGINVHDLSHELSKAFFKMIFFDGSSFYIPIISDLFFSRSHNFEIVLLDHGLYRRLTDSLRLDYAHLWDSLIRGNEEDILKYSHRIFTRPTTAIPAKDGIDHHRLFASMLTGRSWALISSSNGTGTASALATARTSSELDEVHTKVQSGRFFIAIAEVLAKLPREVLLLLKTNDLLRAVDDDLGVTKGSGESIMTGMMRRVALMGWYCAVVIRDRTLEELAARSTFVMPSWTRGEFWNAWSLYLNVVARIAVLDAWVYARQLVE